MQKKIIALAVAGLVSGTAFAQTNVQIYGSIDYGYSYRFDARNPVPGGSSNGYNNCLSCYYRSYLESNCLLLCRCVSTHFKYQ